MDVVEITQTVHNNQVDSLEEEKIPPAPWPMSKDMEYTKGRYEESVYSLLAKLDPVKRKEMEWLVEVCDDGFIPPPQFYPGKGGIKGKTK